MRRQLPKARSRKQRAFFDWLAGAAPRFRVPLHIEKRTDQIVYFSFLGVSRQINGRLTFDQVCEWSPVSERSMRAQNLARGEIEIYADWQEDCWDIIVWLDAFPVKVATGYTCHECLPEHKADFPDRESLWRDHLFEPLLDWINTELAEAKAVGFYQTQDGGGRWAKLLPGKKPDSEAECLVATVRLRQDREQA